MLEENAADALRRQIARSADLCVKCGLCLAHCPTYGVARDEAESPRGRIALMQGLATGAIALSAPLERHLDGCLTCRACEVVCPAAVPYGELIDNGRQLLASQRPARKRLASVMGAVLAGKTLRYLLAALLMIYQRTGLQALVRRSRVLGAGALARMDSLLPVIHWPRLPAESRTDSGERVALFTNCTSPLTEPAALRAAVAVLRALGCDVAVPQQQTCCGAVYQHAGLRDDAVACATQNLMAFGAGGTVVGIASGCTAQLLEYDLLLGDTAQEAFSPRVRDLHAFIASHPALGQLNFRPLRARVLLHTPCTLRNVVRAEAAVAQLLARIPELEVSALDGGCCGAAGSYFISQPAMADALVKPKVAAIVAARPDYVLSSNVGCAMHLAGALRRAGATVAVCHPIELLAQALAPAPGSAP